MTLKLCNTNKAVRDKAGSYGSLLYAQLGGNTAMLWYNPTSDCLVLTSPDSRADGNNISTRYALVICIMSEESVKIQKLPSVTEETLLRLFKGQNKETYL